MLAEGLGFEAFQSLHGARRRTVRAAFEKRRGREHAPADAPGARPRGGRLHGDGRERVVRWFALGPRARRCALLPHTEADGSVQH